MAEAGCERVKIGFESGSNRILSEVKKLETREEMLKGAEMLKRAGVPFSAYFMAGFPGETDDDLKETIDTVEDDMKKLEDRLKQAQKELEEKIDKRIKKALENPLGAMGG